MDTALTLCELFYATLFVNSLTTGRFSRSLKLVLYELIPRIDFLRISCEIALNLISLDLIDD